LTRTHSAPRLASIALALALVVPVRAQQPVPEPMRVMSFNIRYGTANDGQNRWENRREMLFALLRAENADLIGVQEALYPQIQEILAAVPGYAVAGVGRDDGRTKGEFSAILFRANRFTLSDAGTFWFSDTPEVIASTSWGNSITRICSWARFVDRDGRAFWHYNVHLDHQSQPSRERSTELLARRIAERAGRDSRDVGRGEPAIVTGDLNVGETNPALTALVGSPSAPGPFVDTFRVLHPDAQEAGTFTGFDAARISGDKIDYIFVPRGTEVISAAIVRTSTAGRLPSDHFPVTARIRLK
jgi:endonuclease/exonuclease/phosphatase family metal-dependent hydrolase